MANQHVLVVGATGNLGAKIVKELRALGHKVRATARKVPAIATAGVEYVTADLGDGASLARACAEVDVVVSAVQGLRDVIVDGQTRLLRAAETAGAERFIPSDYALDFYKTPVGGNRNLDLRREFGKTLDGSIVRGTSILCGAFMDLVAAGRIGPDQSGVYKVWGSDTQAYDFTTTDDLAKYIAAVAGDSDSPRYVRVAGDTVTAKQLAAIFAEVRGTPVEIQHAGSVADLDAMIDKMKAADPAPTTTFPVWQQLQYARDMASGLGVLAPLDNARFPAIKPTTIRELLAR